MRRRTGRVVYFRPRLEALEGRLAPALFTFGNDVPLVTPQIDVPAQVRIVDQDVEYVSTDVPAAIPDQGSRLVGDHPQSGTPLPSTFGVVTSQLVVPDDFVID